MFLTKENYETVPKMYRPTCVSVQSFLPEMRFDFYLFCWCSLPGLFHIKIIKIKIINSSHCFSLLKLYVARWKWKYEDGSAKQSCRACSYVFTFACLKKQKSLLVGEQQIQWPAVTCNGSWKPFTFIRYCRIEKKKKK